MAFLIIIISCSIFYLIYYENEINEKIYLDKFHYYIGENKNGVPNGKGQKFNKDDILIY